MEKKHGIIIALIAVCILSIAVAAMYLSSDKNGPVITIDESKVKPYSAEQGEDVLRSYAKAVDEKDGDVSSSIVIENVYIMPDMTRAKVIYVARDQDNNITKYSYMIAYEASEEELGKQEEESMAPEDESSEAATDKESTTAAGTSNTTAAEETTAPTEAVTIAGGPKITMTETEVTVAKGSTFNIMRYISSITDDKDTSDTLSRRIIINGSYNTSIAGDYTLDIYCTDSDLKESNHVEFLLHVK